MATEAGFNINGTFYPAARGLKGKEGRLIVRLTEKDPADVIKAAESGQGGWAASVTAVAIAVWRANPGWTEDQVAAFMDELDFIDVDEQTLPAREGDARPPENRQAALSDDSTNTSERIEAAPV